MYLLHCSFDYGVVVCWGLTKQQEAHVANLIAPCKVRGKSSMWCGYVMSSCQPSNPMEKNQACAVMSDMFGAFFSVLSAYS